MIAIAVLFALAFINTYVSSQEYLVPQNIDVDEILKNDRLTRNYLDCVLGKGKCTPEGEELKKDIPEALQNGCAKCNEKHKEGARKVIHHLIENKPNWWQELESKFDPQGEYKKKYDDLLKKEGLTN
ncbi:ejaculatory bulb-specific protein 3-like [Tribolium madens]|uniref:ejaculatory bulb-specific protein 3-like n=1 Tax=Tribolium madens TaxID=41895 RepID=UPI001CF75B3B|nr:ejaculatory bulb-specific protein 3-like [Tribolium madens]